MTRPVCSRARERKQMSGILESGNHFSLKPRPLRRWPLIIQPLWSSRPISTALKLDVTVRGAGRDENVNPTPPPAHSYMLAHASERLPSRKNSFGRKICPVQIQTQPGTREQLRFNSKQTACFTSRLFYKHWRFRNILPGKVRIYSIFAWLFLTANKQNICYRHLSGWR